MSEYFYPKPFAAASADITRPPGATMQRATVLHTAALDMGRGAGWARGVKPRTELFVLASATSLLLEFNLLHLDWLLTLAATLANFVSHMQGVNIGGTLEVWLTLGKKWYPFSPNG